MRLVSSFAIAVVAIATAGAQPRGVPPQEAVALTNASVVDVRTGAIRRGATVVTRGGRIESVGAGAVPAGTRAIDLGGRFVVPGLIDAHVHVGSLAQMRAALESGVTTMRSAGVPHFVDVGLRELVKNGFVAGPDLIAAGYHVRPGMAFEFFLDFPNEGSLMAGANTAEAIRRVVRANLSRGVDWIKTNATERAGTPDTDPRRQLYSQEELRILVVEAEAKNIPVMAHAHGAEGADAAVRAGVRSIEHGTYLRDDTLQLMAKQGTYFDPTLDIVNDLAEPGGDYDNAALKRRGEMMRPILRAAVARAAKFGVKIVAGSDTGYGPNSVARVAREISELVDAGLTPLQALQAATITNAEMLRLDMRIGAVEAGFEADLLVVDGNPLDDIRTLLDPLLVVSNGRIALDRLTFAVAPPAAAQTRASGGLESAQLTAEVEKLLQGNEGAEASVWLGGADGDAWFARDADRIRPTASAIKTFYLVELFSAYAGRLDHPLPAADAVLSDDAHPAISHFSPEVRDEIRRDLGGASVRRVAEVMIGTAPASNAVYNAAANLTTAALGGPEALTALIRKRDPAFAQVSARRYMLRDRTQPGDNEAPAAAFAALYQRLASSRLQGIDAETMAAIHATLESRPDPTLGKHFAKSGSLTTDPMTQVRAGWWHTADGPLVYVVMTMRRSPGPEGRDVSQRRLSETCEALRAVMGAAGRRAMR